MVEKTLSSVGFTPEMQSAPVASLSGGWKMKLALGAHSACSRAPTHPFGLKGYRQLYMLLGSSSLAN